MVEAFHPDEVLENPSENSDFMERFRSVFIKKVPEVIKKLKLKKPIIIVGLDCPRKNIWRNQHFDKYKAHREIDDTFMGGSVFKLVHKEELFGKAGAHMTIRHPHLEADDCLALTVRNIRNVTPDAQITIITSDMDYLQLADEKTKLFNLKYKDLTMSKIVLKIKKRIYFVKLLWEIKVMESLQYLKNVELKQHQNVLMIQNSLRISLKKNLMLKKN